MTGVPTAQDGAILAGVKAKPYGWPSASLDPGCGGADRQQSGTGPE
jgi:hypothetical protein